MQQTTHSTGLWPRFKTFLLGERASRLTERASRAHLLSYLLIVSQSVAVVLVLGHAELPLLFSASLAIRALASMGLFVLVATVLASDIALLETLRRIPVLARNRQRGQLREHLLYVGFVLVTESATYGVVMAALDTNPRALVTAEPLIPDHGPLFLAVVALRAALVAWTAVQLVIVRGKLPVLLSTLTATGKEIIGAHVEQQLAALNIRNISLPAAFKVYAAMSKPPRRIKTAFNGWLVRRELAQEAEEERQVQNVVSALEELEERQQETVNAIEEHPTTRTPETPETPDRPPTGPGSPTAQKNTRKNSEGTPAPKVLPFANDARDDERVAGAAQGRSGRSSSGAGRTPGRTPGRTRQKPRSPGEIEQAVRAVWRPGMTVTQLERAAGLRSRSTAYRWWGRLAKEPAEQVAQ